MKETRNLTCIRCPLGCPLSAELEDGRILSVSGNTCPRGEAYARKEISDPTRTVTTTIRVTGGELPMVSCKTVPDVPKDMTRRVSLSLAGLSVAAPVSMGQVLVRDVCSTGSDMVATRSVAAV